MKPFSEESSPPAAGAASGVPGEPAALAPEPAPVAPAGKFVQGSILRHTLVMTTTGAVGALSIFLVDLLSLLYVSWLGRTELKAAVGFASQVLLYPVSINIGLTIAVTALVSRAIGRGDRLAARRLAASGLTHSALISAVVAVVMIGLADPMLHALGAKGETFTIARSYLWITLPANVAFALGMTLSGLLRSIGDARRAMLVTLVGALVTAIVDPVLIFGFGLGITGAAISTVVSRLVFLVVGLHGAAYVHGLVQRPRLPEAWRDAAPIVTIALPAMLTNIATPIGNGYALHVFAGFGDAAVAASAIIDRVVYVGFAVVFALTGAVGPIIGQNLGARQFGRVRETLANCFLVTTLYSLMVWLCLATTWPWIVVLFHANPETAAYIGFFCRFGVSAWLFISLLFVANASFNNLGHPLLSTAFNWGRATLGTLPFATLGAAWGGVEGAQLGIAAGAAIFGSLALITAFMTVGRLTRRERLARADPRQAVSP